MCGRLLLTDRSSASSSASAVKDYLDVPEVLSGLVFRHWDLPLIPTPAATLCFLSPTPTCTCTNKMRHQSLKQWNRRIISGVWDLLRVFVFILSLTLTHMPNPHVHLKATTSVTKCSSLGFSSRNNTRLVITDVYLLTRFPVLRGNLPCTSSQPHRMT